MRSFAALAPLVLMASSSLVDALPSPVRIEGAVPSVTNADGSVNHERLNINMEGTFAKYDSVEPGKRATLKVKKRGAGKCRRSPSSAPLALVKSGNAETLVRWRVVARPSLSSLIVVILQYTANVKIGTPAQTLRAFIVFALPLLELTHGSRSRPHRHRLLRPLSPDQRRDWCVLA